MSGRVCKRQLGSFLVALVPVLAACGLVGTDHAHGSSRGSAVSTAVTQVKTARTVRASFTFLIKGNSSSAKIVGDADIIPGTGIRATYEQTSNYHMTDLARDSTGALVVTGGSAYLQWSEFKMPRGKKWFRLDRPWTPDPDKPTPAGWYAPTGLQLLDPLLLLAQGPVDEHGEPSPATLNGATTRVHKLNRNLGVDPPDQRLAAWNEQAGDVTSIDLTLWVDAQGRPVRLKIDTSGLTLTSLQATIDYHDYGSSVTVTPPPASKVTKV